MSGDRTQALHDQLFKAIYALTRVDLLERTALDPKRADDNFKEAGETARKALSEIKEIAHG